MAEAYGRRRALTRPVRSRPGRAWEGVLGNLAAGARLLSVGQYSLGIANSIAHDPSLHAALTLGTSVGMGLAVTAVTLIIAARGLASFPLKGEPA